MAAGNDGSNKPEDDDPFGYLYEDGQAAGAQAPHGGGYGYPGSGPAQPGVPRTSYNQVRTVGDRRQYGGGQQHAQPYVPPQQQAPYGQPHAQYAAPETYGGQQPPRQTPPPPQRGGSGRGPNTRGLLIGAVAVVAVVVLGIAAAVITNMNKDPEDDKAGGTTPTPTASSQPSETPSGEPSSPTPTPTDLPRQDAATLQLGGPAKLDTAVKGAKGPGGAYVVFNGQGGSASWTVEVPESGDYTLRIVYSVPGKDAKTSLTVNGEQPREIRMNNWAQAPEGDWEKGWTYTYSYVKLKKGTSNSLKISCEQGDSCDAILDQVYLEAGQTGKR
ncbi:carbohydrate-binding protein [Streptomyces cinereoruber]|uniref:carbohydrate-binding protein n=1 Tax=Streptomyces cinereoruber TaxID=67260 RepID=UPI003676C611